MAKTRITFFAALMGLATLAGAHHATTGSGAPAPAAHGTAPEAGAKAFVSTFTGGSFILPGATK